MTTREAIGHLVLGAATVAMLRWWVDALWWPWPVATVLLTLAAGWLAYRGSRRGLGSGSNKEKEIRSIGKWTVNELSRGRRVFSVDENGDDPLEAVLSAHKEGEDGNA